VWAYMKPLHGPPRAPTSDGFGNLLFKGMPFIQWLDAKELEQGVQFFHRILPEVTTFGMNHIYWFEDMMDRKLVS